MPNMQFKEVVKLDYDINYLQEVLLNIRNNPYGIKYSQHYLRKSYQRDINRGLVDEKLLSEVPAGIQKAFGYNNRFELIFEFNNNDDLYIVVDIINSDEICIMTVIPKDKKRRQH